MRTSFQQFIAEIENQEMHISSQSIHLILRFFDKHDLVNNKVLIKKTLIITKVLLDIQCDEEMFLATLLYQFVYEKNEYLEEIQTIFGQTIAQMIQDLNKMKAIESLAHTKKTEVLRKMLISLSSDLRVILILIAEKIAYVQNIHCIPKEKQTEYLKNILRIYVPIARRLGAYSLKEMLEEEIFQILFPQDYKYISKIFKTYSKKQEKVLNIVKKEMQIIFTHAHISYYHIEYRIKKKYSIWEKMKKNKDDTIENIYDIFAIRIITDTVENCYKILGLIHKKWTPIQNRIKDYIAVPKINGYKSIHTTLIGLGIDEKTYKPIEIQIRTQDMHEEAEKGFAAHWAYKENKQNINLQWEKSLKYIDNESDDVDNDTTKNISEYSLDKSIFVLTPKGEIKVFPLYSTPIDFAYAIDVNLGNHILFSKVNGIKVPLDSHMQNGDIIEIQTHQNRTPNPAWINIVKTNTAKKSIQSWLKSQEQDDIMKMGITELNEFFQTMGHDPLDESFSILSSYQGKNLSLTDRQNLIKHVGAGEIKGADVVKNIFQDHVRKKRGNSDQNNEILVMGENGVKTQIASCCHPIKGDNITGYTTRGAYVSIHKSTCSFIKKTSNKRLIQCYWALDSIPFEVEFHFQIQNILGITSKILQYFAKNEINMLNINITTDKATNIAEAKILTHMQQLNHLNWLTEHLKSIKGVVSLSFIVKN